MSTLDSGKRAKLPASAFAYVDSKGRRRLPIHDEPHVRNALARFNQVAFEDEAARERARKKLLVAARKYGIVPIGFVTGQLESRASEATAGRLVVELVQAGTPAEFERRVRTALRDPALSVLHWSESAGAYLDRDGQPVALPAPASDAAPAPLTTLLERDGQPMTALVHSAAVLKSRALLRTVTAAIRLAVENDRLRGRIEEAIDRYIAGLGAVPDHPFAARRSRGYAFSGSWSSRLKSGGFHINHLHPGGWISSCYYADVPAVVSDDVRRQGWIKFGQPSFDVGLEPERAIQPVPGRLVLFPSYMWHGTIPFQDNSARATIAFDVVPAGHD